MPLACRCVRHQLLPLWANLLYLAYDSEGERVLAGVVIVLVPNVDAINGEVDVLQHKANHIRGGVVFFTGGRGGLFRLYKAQ